MQTAAQMKMPSKEAMQQAEQDIRIVHLINGKDANGEDFYAYIAVRPARYEDFVMIARAREQMDLNEFGTVLKGGFGLTPPVEVMQFMVQTYNVDHDFINNIKKASLQA